MRAFTKAAALLLAQSVVGESMPGTARRISATETIPTAYVTLKVPLEEAGAQIVPLRLDVVEADDACGTAKLSINGQPLAQDADGFGQGPLTLADDAIITANWTFTCRAMKQVLTVHILSLNGKATAGPDTSFTANFYQTTPVQIASVERVANVKYLHLHTTVTESFANSGDDHVEVEMVDEEKVYTDNVPAFSSNDDSVSDQILELEDLRAQARELAALIRDQELTLKEQLSHGFDKKPITAVSPTVTPEECRNVRCAYKAMMEKIRNGPDQLCEVGRGWKSFFLCVHGWEQSSETEPVDMTLPDDIVDNEVVDDEYVDDLGEEYEDMEWVDVYEGEDSDSLYIDYERYLAMRHLHSVRIRMLILVAETALIFGTALFFVTTLLRRLTIGRRRRQQQHAANELPRYQGYRYFDEPKTLISLTFLDGGLCEEGIQSPGHGSRYPDEKAILRAAQAAANTDSQDNNNSVADEISQLREAASVVSDLVAVDAAERRSSMDYDDEAPPAYDEREHSL